MSSSSANLLMKYYRELTDPKKAIPSFHITVSKTRKREAGGLERTTSRLCQGPYPVCVPGGNSRFVVRRPVRHPVNQSDSVSRVPHSGPGYRAFAASTAPTMLTACHVVEGVSGRCLGRVTQAQTLPDMRPTSCNDRTSTHAHLLTAA